MFDVNGDGKHDWHDDYVIQEIIGSENKKTAQRGSDGCLTMFVVGLVVWGIINALAEILY
jgi:hypothetical protein